MRSLRISLAVLTALALAGCGKDQGKCLASHENPYEYTQQILVGFAPCGNGCNMPLYVYVPSAGIETVCDRWEFPEGRPASK